MRGQALAEVTKAEHAALGSPLTPQRARDALNDLPGVQGEPVGAMQQRGLTQFSHALNVHLLIHHTAAHPLGQRVVVAGRKEGLWHAPVVGQTAVASAHFAVQTEHQDAVRRGLERGLQFGHHGLSFTFNAALVAAVAQAHQAMHLPSTRCQHTHAARNQGNAAAGGIHGHVRAQVVGCVGVEAGPVGMVFGRGNQGVDLRANEVAAFDLQQRASAVIGHQHTPGAGVKNPGGVGQGLQQQVPGLAGLWHGGDIGATSGGHGAAPTARHRPGLAAGAGAQSSR